MGKQRRRIPRWLSVDLMIFAVSLIIIAVGVWIGLEGESSARHPSPDSARAADSF